MTAQRYSAYRRVLSTLDLVTDSLAPGEREDLADAAEGLLLSRPGEEGSARRLMSSAGERLVWLVADGRWHAAAAEMLFDDVLGCGPALGRDFDEGSRTRLTIAGRAAEASHAVHGHEAD